MPTPAAPPAPKPVDPLYPEDIESEGDSIFGRDDYELPVKPGAKAEEDDSEEADDDEADDADEDAEEDDKKGESDDEDDSDDEEGDDDDKSEDDDDEDGKGEDDDMDAKLERARQKALGEVESDEDKDTVNDRFDKLEKDLADSRKPAPDASKLPWHQEGSKQDPPSWPELIAHIEEKAVTKAVKLVADTIRQNQESQNKNITALQRQATSLIDEGLIEKDEVEALVKFAKKVKSPDLISAFEGYKDAREGAGNKAKVKERRKTVASKVNRRERNAPRLKKPTYRQISERSLDDIVEDAMRGIKRTIKA